MGIRIVHRDLGDGDWLNEPAFFCDTCNREIKNVREGMYCWPDNVNAPAVPYFYHKGACDSHKTYLWGELTHFAVYVNNVVFDSEEQREETEDHVRSMRGITFP